jgi:glycosyltransferase involved in cell wall biosynthesis
VRHRLTEGGAVSRRILYVQYTNPAGYPPLEHSSRILADGDWQVLFLGTGAFGADRLRFPPHPRIAVRQMPFCPAGPWQKLHYLGFILWLLTTALRWRPDWVYASDPLSCPAAVLLSYLIGVQILYHEHDSPGAAQSWFSRLLYCARRRLAHRAHLCVLPNGERAARFARDTGRSAGIACVWNCPTRDEVSATPRPGHRDGLAIVYHGSIVPTRLPETVALALAQLPPSVELRVFGYETVGHAGYAERLAKLVPDRGAAGRIELIGAIPYRRDLLERIRQSHVGLALLPTAPSDANEQHMVGASNKPFDYLASGLAVLVPDTPEWRRTYVEPGYGLACDPGDPGSIAAALCWFLVHPKETRAMGERGRQRILAEWNYEAQFAPVLKVLKAAVRCSSFRVE